MWCVGDTIEHTFSGCLLEAPDSCNSSFGKLTTACPPRPGSMTCGADADVLFDVEALVWAADADDWIVAAQMVDVHGEQGELDVCALAQHTVLLAVTAEEYGKRGGQHTDTAETSLLLERLAVVDGAAEA